MKIAITGKGGVGKTTLSAVLARIYAAEGKKTIAVDVDPDANLGVALGFTPEEVNAITPVSEMEELIKERTGSGVDGAGKFFKINPKVDDIPDRFALEKNGVRFLVMGTVKTGGGGCVCPEHVVLKRLISHLVVQREEVVIMDMEAGIEHLGRGTASMVDRFIVVIEPGARSVQTYHLVKKLAADLGVKQVSVVANKVRTPEDEDFVKNRIPADAFLGFIHYNDDIIKADREGTSPFDAGDRIKSEIAAIKERL
ncbi:MAG: AAA family ATPase [Spirochaetaceae bacterium]|jgi:CO dehydrogenase maturation factor|nr:AAA family ATPase [Spirochaetaceae bacterium]